MFNESNIPIDDRLLISWAAHVLERTGLAMAGAMIGIFVAAQLARTNVALFNTFDFIVLTVLSGMIGFYLGVNIPRLPNTLNGRRSKVDPVEWSSMRRSYRRIDLR
jgi:prolipoprotein diacylglyceryltransferase